ncbi:hypothetical protein ANO11243_063100 [Dothideomycetidae sp. 11243]|nr:hypothetical protein ANO11243_063100 [fungal sp. No.11243]
MSYHGQWQGVDNGVMEAAYKFFKKRDLAGVKPAPASKKRKRTDEDDEEFDVSGIHLDGEDEGDVPIYDTCQDMRTKINAHLRNSSMSMAELGRRMGAMLPESKKLSGAQITSFLQKKGPYSGAESGVYYASYVFFEKLRIKKGGKESKKRLEVKDAHPKGWDRPYFDNAGRTHIVPGEKALVSRVSMTFI